MTSSLQNIMMTEKVEKEEQMRMRKKSLNTIQVSSIKKIKQIVTWKSSSKRRLVFLRKNCLKSSITNYFIITNVWDGLGCYAGIKSKIKCVWQNVANLFYVPQLEEQAMNEIRQTYLNDVTVKRRIGENGDVMVCRVPRHKAAEILQKCKK